MNRSVPSILGAVLLGVLAHQGPVFGQGEWYEGKTTGFWGLSPDSQVFEGAISKFGLSAFGGRVEEPAIEKHYSGYRFTDLFTLEGSTTSLSLPRGACGYDSLGSDLDSACHGAAWSVTGVATLQQGLSLYGRLGLQYWDKQRGADLLLLGNGQQELGTMYGVGMSYRFRKDWYLHYDLERYSDLAPGLGLRPGRELGLDTSIHSIGLSIRF